MEHNRPKDYLSSENERNKNSGDLFVAMVRRAFGCENDVLIGHHITFEAHGDLKTENEIPSADTLIFDHEVMIRVFADMAVPVMQTAAALPCEVRDRYIREQYEIVWGKL